MTVFVAFIAGCLVKQWLSSWYIHLLNKLVLRMILDRSLDRHNSLRCVSSWRLLSMSWWFWFELLKLNVFIDNLSSWISSSRITLVGSIKIGIYILQFVLRSDLLMLLFTFEILVNFPIVKLGMLSHFLVVLFVNFVNHLVFVSFMPCWWLLPQLWFRSVCLWMVLNKLIFFEILNYWRVRNFIVTALIAPSSMTPASLSCSGRLSPFHICVFNWWL